MKHIYTKLAISALSIVIALTMVMAVSFAWMTLSESPVVSGIQVTIGGGNTILVAADVTETVNGETVHYPGKFSSTLDFSTSNSYDFLSNVGGLLPVSTGDGVNWIIPTYNENTGLLNDISQFKVDNTMAYANQEQPEEGNYICLDFWIVAPDSKYDVHVSCDQNTHEGSYLVELPSVSESESGEYSLDDSGNRGAESARVGFLVSEETVQTGDAMNQYVHSTAYDTRFKKLKGVYEDSDSLQFTIYEPNATTHWNGVDGAYVETRPLFFDRSGNKIFENSFSRITAQKSSTWRSTASGTLLQQYFQAYIAKTENVITAEEAANSFYRIPGQIASTVSAGSFIASTQSLMNTISDGSADPSQVNALKEGGATDDVVVTSLERNVPQRVRMFIWLEGQDVDCTNDTSLSVSAFALSIELAGETK